MMTESSRRAVLIDSSAILAMLSQSDSNHVSAVKIATSLGGEGRPVFITNHLQAEAHALLLRKLGRGPAREWLLRHGLEVIRATAADEDAASALVAEFEDKDWSFCDALSFTVIVRRRAAGAFSFDHHFAQYGQFRVWGVSRR